MNMTKNYIGSSDISRHVISFISLSRKKNLNNQLKNVNFLIIYCKLMTAGASYLQRVIRMLRKRFKGDYL